MLNKTKKRMLSLLLSLCMLVSVFSGCGDEEQQQTTAAAPAATMTYTVQVINQGGLHLPDVGVYVYEDATCTELVWFANTDAEGKITFTDAVSDSYVAVLQNVPTGYAADEMYPITGELTQIVLAAGQMSEDTMDEVTYKLGDMMMDFTVEEASKDTYTLSKLLEQKKAVVLNFWYVECAPCKAEFPYLQEAYEQYSEDIALLALNPVNTAEEVEAFKSQLGLTFPMIACDAKWEKMMNITAYPTTVVIDRFGNIVLIHKGSVDNAKTFADAFAWFTSDAYEQKLITDIQSLVQEEEEGSESNPIELGGVMDFEVTVEPGKVVYTDLYKVKNMYLQIANKDAYVIYNGKTYEPKNGIVGLVVNAPDNYTPAKIGIGNKGSQKQTFKAVLSILQGTINNPYPLSLGDLDVHISAGNEQGVYYSYTAKEDGVLTVKCLKATSGVQYGYTLYNLNSYAQRTLESEGSVDADGYKTLSIEAKKGQEVQLIVATLPDSSNTYPAADLKLQLSFTAGEIKEEEKVETMAYSVTLKDNAGQPIPNVSIQLTKEVTGEEDAAEPVRIATNAQGVAEVQLPKGNYKGTFTVPDGYDPVDNNSFSLTEEKPSHEITLTKTVIVMHNYTVLVQDANETAVAGAKVKIGDTIMTTDAAGRAVFQLIAGAYSVQIQELPGDYVAQQTGYDFAAGQTQLQIVLSIKPGTAGNPYQMSNYPGDTATIEAGSQLYYLLQNAQNRVLNIRNDAAYVIYQGITYNPVEGLVSVPLGEETEASVIIGNRGEYAGAFTLRLSYPLGAQENPILLSALGALEVSLREGQNDGCFYRWTAAEEGSVHFNIQSITDGVQADVVLTVGDVTVKLSESATDEVTIPVMPEDVVTIRVVAIAGADEKAPATQLTVDGQFRLPPNSAEHPDVLTDISLIPVSLEAGDTDGWFYTWTPENGGVARFWFDPAGDGDIILSVSGSETVVKLSDGMVDDNGNPVAAVTVVRGDRVSIQVIGNTLPAQLTVVGELTQDPNSAQNPTVITDIAEITTNLVAGDTDGHYYIWTAQNSGKVSFAVGAVTDGVQTAISLQINGGQQLELSAGKVEAEVKAGDEVLICVRALADIQTGEYPAARIVTHGTFTHRVGSKYNPQTVTDVSELTALLEANDPDGHHFVWVANNTGNMVFHIAAAELNGAAVSTDPAEKLDITLYVNGVYQTRLSQNEAKDAEGNRIVSLSVKKNDSVLICVTGLDAVAPSGTVKVVGKQNIPYTVTVTDMQGKVFSNVAVTVRDQNNAVVHNASTDASGVVRFTGAAGTYTVELAFEGTAYYYNKEIATLTGTRADLTIQLANYMDTTKVYDDLWALNGADTYVLNTGSTYVEIGAGKPYFCEDQDSNCLFIFHPTQGGTYKFTVDNPNAIITYRNSPFYAFQVATSEGTEDNSFTYSVGNSTAGNIDMIIGVKGVDGINGVVINITRIGDPDFTWEDIPVNMDWKQGHTHGTACQCNVSGLTYLDINAASGTYDLYYNAATGFYQLEENGPVIYVDLNSSRYGISLCKIIHGDGVAGGAPIRKYFYDENGAYLKREDYTDTLDEYFICAGLVDVTTNSMVNVTMPGYHPLTKDLLYILQSGGAKWWDSSSPDKIEQLVAANPQYAWMFLCGYVG